MIRSTIALIVVSLVRLCAAQQSGWVSGQINATMCQWQSFRAAVIRDTLFIDGGELTWIPGMSDGSLGAPTADGNPYGIVYTLNFSSSFTTSENTTLVFNETTKGVSGDAVYNLAPQYYDGAMFANDYEYLLYGGLPDLSNVVNPQPDTSFAAYYLYSSPAPGKTFIKGFDSETMVGLTRYVADGAAVSVPSENLAFYFGGGRSESWGPIYYLPGPANESVNADQPSLTLIEADLSPQYAETWINHTLPSTVPGRFGAELVWVPVSEQGVLVAIGGVIFPQWLNVNQTNNASATSQSQTTSPTFLETVSVYDIANQVWYEQPTSGWVPTSGLAQGCTVLASAEDGSSHNIYWYGGFDGLHPSDDFNDNVYVLSLPSFIWTQVYTGNSSHGRAGHRCTKPYPDQMIVIGGYASETGEYNCPEGFIQIYNLSSNTWLDSYDPKVWSNYSVPSSVYAAIGGSATGGATATAPSPTGFANSSMVSLFGTAYNTTKITNWYPYTPASTATTTSSPTSSLTPVPVGKSGTPSYLAPVLGVVLGLFFVTLLILAFMLWRRRSYLRQSSAAQSDAGTMDNRRWVDRWLSGTPAVGKAVTVTTDETIPQSPEQGYKYPNVPEIDQGVIRYEMDATDKPLELQTLEATGLSPMVNGRANGIAHSNSVNSHASQTSSISDSSYRPNVSPVNSPRADSPAIVDPRIVSGVSNISEADRSHMRGISETSVSTIGGYGTPSEGFGMDQGFNTAPAVMDRPAAVSPLTPPSATGLGANDYLGASGGSNPNPRRKSNFSEGLEEVEGK